MAASRLLLTAVWWYASSGHRLTDERFPMNTIRIYRIRGLAIPVVFLISIGISFFSVNAATCSWLLLIVADTVLLRVLSRQGR